MALAASGDWPAEGDTRCLLAFGAGILEDTPDKGAKEALVKEKSVCVIGLGKHSAQPIAIPLKQKLAESLSLCTY